MKIIKKKMSFSVTNILKDGGYIADGKGFFKNGQSRGGYGN